MMTRNILMVVAMCLMMASKLLAADAPRETQANVMTELSFTSASSDEAAFKSATLDAVFTDPAGKELRVPGFWAGGKVWKVRYASPTVGLHKFRTEFSIADDKAVHNATGEVTIKPYTGSNPLYQHGPLHVSENKRYLEHADGTPFFWLGDTWWMGLCHRMKWPEDVKKLAEDRKAKGFNVIQLVAGLYPDMHPFDPRGANEAGFPWEKDYAAIRPEYFNAADERILYLVDQGFSPCIVGTWGYFMEWMGPEKMKLHWRNLIARYGALPVTWCAAGEANLPWYLAKNFPYDDRKQVTQWTDVMRFIRATDPFHRPLTIHPTGIGRLSARHCTDDLSLLDFDMLQTPHGERNAVPATISTVRESYADQPVMPVINGEASYERLMDTIGTEWTRRMFWICMTSGAAGHTYGANGIWQVNRPGQPHGPSPHHPPGSTGYGVIPWQEAMNLGGSSQEGYGKKLLTKYEWQKFVPHPEWVRYATSSGDPKFDAAQWIWFNEGSPVEAAPTEKRYLRKKFDLPGGKKIKSAKLAAAADDFVSARVNGHILGSSSDWKSPVRADVASILHDGANVLAMAVENKPAAVEKNPAGLIVALEVQFEDGSAMRVQSDGTWRASKGEAKRWEDTDFADASWDKALAMGAYGMMPWGQISPEAGEAAYATGITEGVRVIYVPLPNAVELRDLPPESSFTAIYFDPVTGEETSIGEVRADKNGAWSCPPPKSVKEEDWVVVIQPSAKK